MVVVRKLKKNKVQIFFLLFLYFKILRILSYLELLKVLTNTYISFIYDNNLINIYISLINVQGVRLLYLKSSVELKIKFVIVKSILIAYKRLQLYDHPRR